MFPLKGSLLPPAPWLLATLRSLNVPGRARAPCHSGPCPVAPHSRCPQQPLPVAPWGTPARSPPYPKGQTRGLPVICLPRASRTAFQDSGPEIQPQVSLLPGSPSTILSTQRCGPVGLRPQPFHSENCDNTKSSSSSSKYSHQTCYPPGTLLSLSLASINSPVPTILSIPFCG